MEKTRLSPSPSFDYPIPSRSPTHPLRRVTEPSQKAARGKTSRSRGEKQRGATNSTAGLLPVGMTARRCETSDTHRHHPLQTAACFLLLVVSLSFLLRHFAPSLAINMHTVPKDTERDCLVRQFGSSVCARAPILSLCQGAWR